MTAEGNSVRGGVLAAQLATVAVAIGMAVAAPPASGRMLLVPVTDAAARQLVPLLVAHGGSIVAAGPIAGSLVVDGDRAHLLAPAARAAILMFRTPDQGCGGGAATR